MMSIVICGPGPTKELDRQDVGVRFCFTCRSRQKFFQVLTGEIQPSYYEPWISLHCAKCGKYGDDLGFGRYRVFDYVD